MNSTTMSTDGIVLVTGGGGFIGGHLVASLIADGYQVRSVDIKPFDEWYQRHPEADNRVLDVSLLPDAMSAVEGTRYVFNLAADMGGMGFIENNKALCMLSVLTSTHVLMAARDHGVERLFYSSSACVYAAATQTNPETTARVTSPEETTPSWALFEMPSRPSSSRTTSPGCCALVMSTTVPPLARNRSSASRARGKAATPSWSTPQTSHNIRS